MAMMTAGKFAEETESTVFVLHPDVHGVDHLAEQSRRNRAEADILQIELSRAANQRDDARKRFDELRGLMEALVARLAKLQAGGDVSGNSEVIDTLRQDLASVNKQMEDHRAIMADIRNRFQRTPPAAEAVNRIEKDVMALRREAKLKTRPEIMQLKANLKSIQSQTEQYHAGLDDIRNDISALTEAIEGENGLVAMRGDLRDLRTDVDKNKQRTDAIVRELIVLRRELAARDEQSEGFGKALASLKEEMAEMRTRMGKFLLDQMRTARKQLG